MDQESALLDYFHGREPDGEDPQPRFPTPIRIRDQAHHLFGREISIHVSVRANSAKHSRKMRPGRCRVEKVLEPSARAEEHPQSRCMLFEVPRLDSCRSVISIGVGVDLRPYQGRAGQCPRSVPTSHILSQYALMCFSFLSSILSSSKYRAMAICRQMREVSVSAYACS